MLRRRCVILGNGAAGAENQCIGLAERLGLPYDLVRLDPSFPILRWLPAVVHVTLGRAAAHVTTLLGYDRKHVNTRILAGEHPGIIIGCAADI